MRRSGFHVMARLIGLVKPLAGYMVLAVIMGLAGHLCAAFITILGGYAVLAPAGFETAFRLEMVFVCVLVFAAVRAVLRYAEQACNHFIAFKLLALIRDRVFQALPCKAGGQGQGRSDLNYHFGYRTAGSVLCAHDFSCGDRVPVHGDHVPFYRFLPSGAGGSGAFGISVGGNRDTVSHFEGERFCRVRFSQEKFRRRVPEKIRRAERFCP